MHHSVYIFALHLPVDVCCLGMRHTWAACGNAVNLILLQTVSNGIGAHVNHVLSAGVM